MAPARPLDGRVASGAIEPPVDLAKGDGAPPRLALLGEFSAGKSSLANLLIGAAMLPTSVLSSTRRPTRLAYADRLQVFTVSDDGHRQALGLEELRQLDRKDVRLVEIGLPVTLLRHVEIVDTPGFADPYHDPEHALRVADDADLAIWCTLASQAWRQSEQLTWKSLPERLRNRGLLVVTHCDVLRDPQDRRQLLDRLESQAGAMFRSIVLLSIPDAVRARDRRTGGSDAGLWQQSGGADLAAALCDALAAVADDRDPNGPTLSMAEAAASEAAVLGGNGQAKSALVIATQPAADAALAQALEAMPDCVAAVFLDLASTTLLAIKTSVPASAGLLADIGSLGCTYLFGTALNGIRKVVEPGVEDLDTPLEVVLETARAHYLMLRGRMQPERALILVCARSTNRTLALLRARKALAALDQLP